LELDWENEPLAIGVSMAIKKLEFAGDKLIFPTALNGIGVFDENKKLHMLK